METISVHVTNQSTFTSDFKLIRIPYKINEVELKATLRDLGYIPSDMEQYKETKVFLLDNETKKEQEICTMEFRSLEEIGIKENSYIVIKLGKKPRVPVYTRPAYHYRPNPSDMRCLYGCPMASSVEEAINEAEKYNHDNSVVKEETV